MAMESSASVSILGNARPSPYDQALRAPQAATATGDCVGRIRSFKETDIPRVAEIFSKTFRTGKVKNPPRLAACIRDTYFGSPAFQPERASIVHMNAEGIVDGFMGIIPVSYKLGEQVISAGILSAYMSDDPKESPKIGVALARAVISRPFDILFTDTANRSGLAMARALQFVALPHLSLEWFKVFLPFGTWLYFLNKRLPRTAKILRPMASGLDIWTRLFFSERRATVKNSQRVQTRSIDMMEFVTHASNFLSPYNVRPAWEPAELEWFTKQAARQTKNGLLEAYEVHGRGGKQAGLYLLYVRKGGVAYALQVLARPGAEETVMKSLIEVAESSGAVAIRGATTREAVAGLLSCSRIFYRHVMTTVAWSRNPEIVEAIGSGDIFIGGLAGETWSQIVAEEF